MPEILRLDVADVEKAVPPDAEIHKGRLDARFQIDDDAFVNVAYIIILSGAFDIQFFEYPIFHNGDTALLWLRHVDQHFLFHGSVFSVGWTKQRKRAGSRPWTHAPGPAGTKVEQVCGRYSWLDLHAGAVEACTLFFHALQP